MTKGEVMALVAEIRERHRVYFAPQEGVRVCVLGGAWPCDALRAAEALEFTSIEAVALRFACRDLREQRDEALEGLASGASGQAVSDR